MRRDGFKTFVEDQFGRTPVVFRPMFGGWGLYRGRTFFGILFKGRLYFKTDERSRIAYVERGMPPFRPSTKQTLKTYYEVPAEVLEEPEELAAWAERALRVRSASRNRADG